MIAPFKQNNMETDSVQVIHPGPSSLKTSLTMDVVYKKNIIWFANDWTTIGTTGLIQVSQ